jgi:hypothetical protein
MPRTERVIVAAASLDRTVCEPVVMRWVGDGPELFSVRVDVIAPDDDDRWVKLIAGALNSRLPFRDPAVVGGPAGDQGRGHEGSPVVGLKFMLRASDFGEAAKVAVETALAAASDVGVPGPVYDVVLVPENPQTLGTAARFIPNPNH